MDDIYIHGSEDEEQDRLALMNEIINVACLEQLRLGDERSVLDVGCGTGQFTRAVARTLSSGATITGVDNDPRQLSTAQALAQADGEAGLVEFEFGVAGQLAHAPARRDCFDLVHCRFLLEHLRDPDAAVGDMVRTLRPGGRIVVADDDHALMRIWPEPAGLAQAWQAYYQTYHDHGHDPFIGRRLVQLLQANGARPVRNTTVFYGACAGQRHFDAVVVNLLEVLRGATEAVVASGRMNAADYAEAIRQGSVFAQRADAAIWYGICWAEGTRPA